MRVSSTWLVTSGLLILMVVLVWISQGWNKATGLPGAADIAVVSRIPVEVEPVRTGSVTDAVRAVGTLEANESVIVRPEIAGLVSRILFGEGQAVERGKVLIELDDTELRAHLAQAVAQLKIARLTSDRMTQLLGSNNSFVSQQQIDQAVSSLQTAQANHTVYQTRLAKTKVRAPFAGTVGMRRVSPGDYVQPGQDIVNLEDHATLKIDFKIPETYLNRLSVGQRVEIATDAYPGEVFIGEVYAVDPRVDSVSRAVRVRAGVPNSPGKEARPTGQEPALAGSGRAGEKSQVPVSAGSGHAKKARLNAPGDREGEILGEPGKGPVSAGLGREGAIGKLRPGLFVNIKLELGRNDRAILVPEEAVIRQRDKTYVYRVHEETARWTEVTLGVREQGNVQILAGLHEADTIVRVGQQKLNDGARVTRK